MAATVGGFYVASAIVFGWAALRADWAEMRPLCFGVLAFTIPTLAATAYHEEVFDFGRWQAVAWVGLFVAAPIAYGTLLYLQRGRVRSEADALRTGTRWGVAVLGGLYGLRALVLCVDPPSAGERTTLQLPPMSGRFLGCWYLLLAVLAFSVAIRTRSRESQMAMVALVLLPVGEALGMARALGGFGSTGRGVGAIGAVLFFAAIPAVFLLRGNEPLSPSGPSP